VPEPLLEEEAASVPPHQGQDWPLLVDLGGDGRPQVVVRQAEFSPRFHLPRRSREAPFPAGAVVETVGLRVLDGATGRERWVRRLGRSCSSLCSSRMPFRVLAGEPAKPGGPRDLVVASLVIRWRPGPFSRLKGDLYVDALSGAGGSSRWWRRFPVSDGMSGGLYGNGLGELGWWKAGARGEALLLVPLRVTGGEPQDTEATYVLDGDTGELRHKAAGLEEPRPADLDGDGRPELLGWTGRYARRRSWQPIRGTAPALLEWGQRWKPGKREVARFPRWGGLPELEDKEEPEPTLPPAEPLEDYRREVPLPWAGHALYAGFADSGFLGDLLRTLFLWLLLPVVLVLVALWVWAGASPKAQPRPEGMTEADRADRRRAALRGFLLFATPGLPLVLAVAGAWLALDTERRPGERYIWTGWYLDVAWASVVASGALSVIAAVLALAGRGVGRLWRRWAR
jgi:hypothetical protein